MKGLPHASDPARPGLDELRRRRAPRTRSPAPAAPRRRPRTRRPPTSGAPTRRTSPRSAGSPTRRSRRRRRRYRAPDRPDDPLRDGQRLLRVASRRGSRGAARLRASDGEPFFFKPTDLGTYLLYGTERDFLGGADGASPSLPSPAPTPSGSRSAPAAASPSASTTTASSPSTAGSSSSPTRGTRFTLDGTTGCTAYPEAQINITGAPSAGVSPYQEVRGYVDAHTHGMAFEFLGGGVHCGRPWHEYGAPYALRRLPRPHRHRRQRRRARGAPVRPPDPRPGRLADVQGLAGAGVADPRGHLLPVARALLARRPAGLREPARREQPALPALPDQAQLLRRHGLRPPAGEGHVRAAGLHRRPVGRPRQGLLPDRAQPVGGPAA